MAIAPHYASQHLMISDSPVVYPALKASLLAIDSLV